MTVIKQVKPDQLNSELVTIDVLPSKFMPYRPLTKLEMRAFTLGDLKVLGSPDITERTQIDIFGNAIVNADIMKLSWPDTLFVNSHITLFTIPTQSWTVEVICKNPECRNKISSKLDRDNFFEFEDLTIPDYPLNLELKKQNVQFGILTTQKHLDFIDKAPNIPESLRETYILASMALNLGTTDEAFEFLKSITSLEEMESLNEIDSLLYHDVKPLEIKCDKCNTSNKYEVGLEVSTLRPFRESTIPPRSRITFGSRS